MNLNWIPWKVTHLEWIQCWWWHLNCVWGCTEDDWDHNQSLRLWRMISLVLRAKADMTPLKSLNWSQLAWEIKKKSQGEETTVLTSYLTPRFCASVETQFLSEKNFAEGRDLQWPYQLQKKIPTTTFEGFNGNKEGCCKDRQEEILHFLFVFPKKYSKNKIQAMKETSYQLNHSQRNLPVRIFSLFSLQVLKANWREW